MAYLFVISLVFLAMAFVAVKMAAELMAEVIIKIRAKIKSKGVKQIEETEPL